MKRPRIIRFTNGVTHMISGNLLILGPAAIGKSILAGLIENALTSGGLICRVLDFGITADPFFIRRIARRKPKPDIFIVVAEASTPSIKRTLRLLNISIHRTVTFGPNLRNLKERTRP